MTLSVWASGLRSSQAFAERHGITFQQTLFLSKYECYETEINILVVTRDVNLS